MDKIDRSTSLGTPVMEYTASKALMAKGICTVLRSNVSYVLVAMGTSLTA